nr:hypothetical protein CFP56_13133 [Quercus suber]
MQYVPGLFSRRCAACKSGCNSDTIGPAVQISARDPCVVPGELPLRVNWQSKTSTACGAGSGLLLTLTPPIARLHLFDAFCASPCCRVSVWCGFHTFPLLLPRQWSKRPARPPCHLRAEELQSRGQKPNCLRASDHRMTPPPTLPTIPRAATHCPYRLSVWISNGGFAVRDAFCSDR